jgi:transposase-like protein
MIRAAGGADLRGYENRGAWLSRAARLCGISVSMAGRIWRRQITDPKLSVFQSVSEAAQKRQVETINDVRELTGSAIAQLAEAKRILACIDAHVVGIPIDNHRDVNEQKGDQSGAPDCPLAQDMVRMK